MQARTFQEMLRSYSAKQKLLLIAIAKEGKVEGITGNAFKKNTPSHRPVPYKVPQTNCSRTRS